MRSQANLIVVTGASQGIGAAIAEEFAGTPNAHLILLARTESKLRQVAERCRARGAVAEVQPCDVTSEARVAEVASDVLSRLGPPQVLVNNAGFFQPASISETSPSLFRKQIEINLTSAFLVTHAFLDALLAAGQGDILFVGSLASVRAYPRGAAYCAAKHGLLGFARVLREETRNAGLRVITLLPGATLTPSWEGTDIPEERFIDPADLARLAVAVHRLDRRTVVEEVLIRPQYGDV